MTTLYVPRESTACAVGADALAAALAASQVEADIVRSGSRGAAFLEPLLEISTPEGRIGFPRCSADRLPALFAKGIPDLTHPECCGLVEQLPWFARQTRLTFAQAGRSAPLDYAAWRRNGGGRGLQRALQLPSAAALDELETSGLRGRGGAAFPAHLKWRTVQATDSRTRYIVCNADEGDAGTFADRLLIECDPFQLIEGMAIAGCVLGAAQGYVYLRSEYPEAIAVLREALVIARTHGLLGPRVFDSPHGFDITLYVGAGAYVCGEETALLESIEGRRPVVRAKPPVPAVAGLFGEPTLVHNVLSLAALTTIYADGAAAYAAHGIGRSRGTMPWQLGGAFATGGLVETPFGLTLRELVDRFGGGIDPRLQAPPAAISALQVGGPLGAYLPPAQWDLPLDYEAFTAAGALLGHGGIIAFGPQVDLAERAEFALRFCAAESCGKCTPCRIGAQRGAELLAQLRGRPAAERGAGLALLDDLLDTMESASLCALGGLTPMPVRSILRGFPHALPGPVRESSP